MVEFAELLLTIGDGGLVQAHFAAAKDGFGMAFPQACLLGYELCDGHAGVSHPEMSLRESQALRLKTFSLATAVSLADLRRHPTAVLLEVS